MSRVITKRTQNTVTGRETVENFSYDAAGNLLTDESMGQEYVYDTHNRLISTSECINVTYDADGNMTYTLLDSELTYLEYDSTNKLISAGNCQYTYNGENIRIRNLCGALETTYVYDTNARLSRLLQKETDGAITKYVYGKGLIGEESENSFKTYHYDYRGSTVAITDMNGNVTDTFAYDTYGKLVARTGTNKIIFLYNGRDGVVTDDNGLLYMRARYYCPELRRFVNSDVIVGEISNAVTLNRYAYANGNPISFVDPFGLAVNWGNVLKVGVGVLAIAGLAVATVATGGAAAVVAGTALAGAVAGGATGAIVGGIEGGIDGAVDGFLAGTLIGGAAGAISSVSGKAKVAVVRSAVNLSTTYISAKVTGQDYTFNDASVAVLDGIISTIIPGKKGALANAAVAGISTTISSHNKGKPLGTSIALGIGTAACNLISIGNLSEALGDPIDEAADLYMSLSVGFGWNLITAATTEAFERKSQKNSKK